MRLESDTPVVSSRRYALNRVRIRSCHEQSAELLSLSFSFALQDGSKWRLFYTNLTHDKLVLYKDEERNKVKEEIDLTLLDSMELEESEQIGNITKLNNFCFSLTASSLVKTYFCAETEEDLLNWTDGTVILWSQ
jgi:hypothetical protein